MRGRVQNKQEDVQILTERPKPPCGFKPRALLLWGNSGNHCTTIPHVIKIICKRATFTIQLVRLKRLDLLVNQLHFTWAVTWEHYKIPLSHRFTTQLMNKQRPNHGKQQGFYVLLKDVEKMWMVYWNTAWALKHLVETSIDLRKYGDQKELRNKYCFLHWLLCSQVNVNEAHRPAFLLKHTRGWELK